MAAIPISTIYPELQLFLPGASEPLIQAAVVAALIDFCDDSLIWWAENPPVLCPAGSGLSLIPASVMANSASVREVYADGVALRALNTLELNGTSPNWMLEVGTPRGFLVAGNELRLVPTNAADVFVASRVAYKPTRAATEVQDWLYEDWWEVIKAGALARLLMIPQQSWTSPTLASRYAHEFEVGCREAKVDANKNRTNASVRVKFRN